MKKITNLKIILTILLLGVSVCFATKYEYDSLNRLSSVSYDNGTKLVYNYDSSGNCSRSIATVISDFDSGGGVNMTDFMQLAQEWLETENLSADIAPWPDIDNIVNFKDFAGFAESWMYGTD